MTHLRVSHLSKQIRSSSMDNKFDLERLNSENLTVLDIAVMTNNVPLAKMLIAHGAQENTRLEGEKRSAHLSHLVKEAEEHVEELTDAVMTGTNGTTGQGVGGQTQTVGGVGQRADSEKQLAHWEWKHRLLKRMKTGFEHAKAPDPPKQVTLCVSSSTSLLVRFDEPDNHNGAIVTKFKVEWSGNEKFSPVDGSKVISDLRALDYCIPSLTQGERCYVRVSAANMKGYGKPQLASPLYAVPSSWRELTGSKVRAAGKLSGIDDLFRQVKNARPADAAEIKDMGDSPIHRRRSNVRKSIKSIFSSTTKFAKTLKRGIYFACLIYHGDRVLVTTEENLPMVEVDENASGASSFHTDFHWMMKVACTWEDIRALRQDMEKISSSSLLHLRGKLLNAASQLQNGIGVQDLGQLFYKPIRDENGSMVVVTVQYIKDPKFIQTSQLKWISLSKVQKKAPPPQQQDGGGGGVAVQQMVQQGGAQTGGAGGGVTAAAGDGGPTAADMLFKSVSEMILYHQVSTISLPRGLYLGYLKLKSSMDLIRVLVPEKKPNVLPHVKIRDNPHVCKEEWEWLHMLDNHHVKSPPTDLQTTFQTSITQATRRLLENLGISDDLAVSHRVYDMEVVELSAEVTFILLLPPAEDVCSVPGQSDSLTSQRSHQFVTLPVQIFEMVHMCTYQPEFIARYSRLSSILEMDHLMAQHHHREAFSTTELTEAKIRLEQLQQFQVRLDESWKGLRWIMDVLTYARDRHIQGGVPLGVLYAPPPTPEDSPLPDRRVASAEDVHDDEKNITFEMVETKTKSQQSAILRVYAAYYCGLAKGSNVKLHVTQRTTCREVVNLVVQQLNKAVLMKGLEVPIYVEDQLQDFCLVAVIGARERCLRDDYRPLDLQNPWTNGKLFVRMKGNVLAAIQQGNSSQV